MNHKSLRRIALLESKIDQLETELGYLNYLLKKVGFERGIETLKIAAHELLAEEALKTPS